MTKSNRTRVFVFALLLVPFLQCIAQTGADIPVTAVGASDGSVIIAGSSRNGGGIVEYRIIGYDAAGNLLGSTEYASATLSLPVAMLRNAPSVLVTGNTREPDGTSSILTVLYDERKLLPVEGPAASISGFSIVAVYPNPVRANSSHVFVEYNTEAGTPVSFVVYDLFGREMGRLETTPGSPGTKVVAIPLGMAAGTYYLVGSSAGKREMRKITVRP